MAGLSHLCRYALLLVSISAFAQQNARDEVQKLLDDQTAAWNRGDLLAFMQGYEKSPALTFFGGKTIERGWDAALARYERTYKGPGRQMGTLQFTESDIDVLSPDAAVFSARWHLLMKDGKTLDGLTTVICKRTKAGWKIVHDHSS